MTCRTQRAVDKTLRADARESLVRANGRTSRSDRSLRRRKRIFDMTVACALLIVALPFLLVASIVLAVQLRGVPFFAQRRPGHHGESLTILKLRTLDKRTPCYASKLDTSLVAVSRFAQFLRDRHLDELPQLLLVVAGRMSLVGPRPRLPEFVEPIADQRYAQLREAVPQACTGLWQISADCAGTATSHPEYDLVYLRYASLRMDVWILARTAYQLVAPARITLDQVPEWTLGGGFDLDVPPVPVAAPRPPLRTTIDLTLEPATID